MKVVGDFDYPGVDVRRLAPDVDGEVRGQDEGVAVVGYWFTFVEFGKLIVNMLSNMGDEFKIDHLPVEHDVWFGLRSHASWLS